MKFIQFIIDLLTLTTGLTLPAQNPSQGIAMEESDSMTLDEMIVFALQNNPDIRNSQLDLISNDARIKEITSQGLPQINGTGRSEERRVGKERRSRRAP